ncbi:MAG: anthranilate synthase component I family protein [Peptoniphilus sp.]|uniref:anthranilate synthase component I family protein n=1 Tax=Peptoniphilus sp. TaxID=1971214 RepID=UPI002A748028|nr:anthranilate synthase component I family protein [Peptoniphilus sp.]MDY2987847.1 anthranilate synthase component I family protein [Peptoniphilus sp.]
MIKTKHIDTDIAPEELLFNIREKSYPFFLDSAKGDSHQGNKSYFGFEPKIIVKSKGFNTEVEGLKNFKIHKNPLDVLRDLMKEYFIEDDRDFIGGAVGYLSYDFTEENCNIVLKAEGNVDIYDAFFGIYFKVIEYDNVLKEFNIIYMDGEDISNIEELFYSREIVPTEYHTEEMVKGITEEEYGVAFDQVREMIKKGFVYEVNLTQQFKVKSDRDPYNLYINLRNINKADFMTYMDFGDYQILSSSPERFFKCKDRVVEARPIKGTIKRSDDKEEDEKLKAELLNSEKNVSELLMIVDLMRNDLSLSCKYETVKAIENYRLESYESVHHLVATIVGELRDEEDIYSLIKNIFPGGSITGAPKLTAIEAIDKVEKYKRNVYTGSLGYISFNENSDLNILIRTILKKGEDCYFSGGGAVTWDSEVKDEYNESLQKSLKLIEALK